MAVWVLGLGLSEPLQGDYERGNDGSAKGKALVADDTVRQLPKVIGGIALGHRNWHTAWLRRA